MSRLEYVREQMRRAYGSFLSLSDPYERFRQRIRSREETRLCVICGITIDVLFYWPYKYKGGNYFFGKGLTPDEGIGGEYWECDICFIGDEC